VVKKGGRKIGPIKRNQKKRNVGPSGTTKTHKARDLETGKKIVNGELGPPGSLAKMKLGVKKKNWFKKNNLARLKKDAGLVAKKKKKTRRGSDLGLTYHQREKGGASVFNNHGGGGDGHLSFV